MNMHLTKAHALYSAWKRGELGGEIMPEDAKPAQLGRMGEDVLRYFTLPMALNYQRNSYKLWEAATKTWNDKHTHWVFNPSNVTENSFEDLQDALLTYRVALQPNKHPQTWRKIALTVSTHFHHCVEDLLQTYDFDILKIKQALQGTDKPAYPYLSGTKICNYWLYVLTQYTDYPLKNRHAITIAPDTHVIQASCKLGLITIDEALQPDVQHKLEQRWSELLKNSGFDVIDLHTPLWLWSRAGFPTVKGIY